MEEDRDVLPPGLGELLRKNLAGELHGPGLVPGLVVAEKWKLTRLLGSGGFGTVFEAWHLDLDQPFAIKFLDGRHGQEETQRAFLDEARLMSQLRGRHLVRVLHFAELPDGTPYYVMDLVKGPSLRQHLGSSLSMAESVEILEGVLEGLCEVHGHGYTHGDLKPENIVLSDRGTRVQLLDFGLARTSTLARGAVGGTPPYMAPEAVLEGAIPDARADLYAAGVIFYEMVAGRLPRGYQTMDLDGVRQSWTRKPDVVSVRVHRPEVPEEVDRLIMEVLSRVPEDRPPTAGVMLRRLRTSRDWRGPRAAAGSRQNSHAMIASALLPVVVVVTVWATRLIDPGGRLAGAVEDVVIEPERASIPGPAAARAREAPVEAATVVETVTITLDGSSASTRPRQTQQHQKRKKRRRPPAGENSRDWGDSALEYPEFTEQDERSTFRFLIEGRKTVDPPGSSTTRSAETYDEDRRREIRLPPGTSSIIITVK